jgi:putative DNA-invertase from lambdoid prophage Rac
MTKTILYARVSTTDQTIDHQAVQARAAGFTFDEVLADEGVSGVRTTLAERAQGKRLFDMLRSGDTLVMRWVDRLGRNYADVTEAIRQFMARGVIVRTVINGLVFDGAAKDPMQKAVRDALIAFMAATAEAQAEATRETQKAGSRSRARPEASPC